MWLPRLPTSSACTASAATGPNCWPNYRGSTAAMTAGVAAGEVWVEVLATKERTLGVALSFATCGRVSLYQNARTTDRDADNAGTALGLAAVRQAIEKGFTEVDLLRGEEAYKFEWGERVRGMSRVRAAHGVLALGVLIGIDVASRAKRTVQRISRAARAWRAGSGSSPPSSPA